MDFYFLPVADAGGQSGGSSYLYCNGFGLLSRVDN